jgi:YD repeat-containing protein
MNCKSCILVLVVALSFFAACSSKNTSTETDEVVFDDRSQTNEKGEVVIQESDFLKDGETFQTNGQNQEDTTTSVADGSQITVMYDAYGNKVETRRFFNDSRIKYLMVRTSVTGQREVLVFGQSGQTRPLPANMLDKAMVSTAAELSSATGLSPVGIRQNRTTPTFPSLTTKVMPVAAPTFPTVQIKAQNPTTENNAPQNETREPVTATETDTGDKKTPTEATKPPTALSENLKNFLPKKRRNAMTDNKDE